MFECNLCIISVLSEMSLPECGENGSVFMPCCSGCYYCTARRKIPAGVYCSGWSGEQSTYVMYVVSEMMIYSVYCMLLFATDSFTHSRYYSRTEWHSCRPLYY